MKSVSSVILKILVIISALIVMIWEVYLTLVHGWGFSKLIFLLCILVVFNYGWLLYDNIIHKKEEHISNVKFVFLLVAEGLALFFSYGMYSFIDHNMPSAEIGGGIDVKVMFLFILFWALFVLIIIETIMRKIQS